MDTLIPHRKRLAGFSLVEMAIVLLITGILMSAGLSLLTVKMNAAQWETTKKNQEAIKQALINYLGKNLRLPCPGDSSGAELRTGSPCNQYAGIVPYKELGLDRAAALDGWENFITYVVSPNPPSTTPPPLTAWLYKYGTPSSSQVTTDPSLAFWPSNTSGAINVTGTSTLNGMVVALISYGKNGYGAYNVKVVTPNAFPYTTNTDEHQNANPVSGVPSVVKRDATDTLPNSFDDIVMIISAQDLTGPLIANGTLQSSAQAALSQANDIVMGNILASKSPPTCTAIGCATGVSPSCDTYQYTCTSSYTIPTPASINPFTSPPNVVAWGVSYAPASGGFAISSTTPASGVAYTLNAGDGTQPKTVSVGELRGILSRAAGF